MRRLHPTRSLGVATAAAAVLAVQPGPPASAADTPYDVLVFSKTAGFRHDAIPAGIQTDPRPGRRQQLHGDRDRGRQRRSPPPTWPSTRRWSSSTPPATCSTPPSRRAFESYIRRGRRLRRRPLRRRHRVRLAVLRRAGRRVLRLAPGHPAGHRQGGGPGARGDRAPRPDLDPHRRVVQLPHQPPLQRARAGHAGRVDVLRRRRWAPTTRTPGARPTRAAGPSTPAAGTPRRVRRAGLPGAAARRHPVRGRPDQGGLPARRPATPTLYNGSTTGWSQAGPGGFTNTDATLTSSGGMGMLWYSAKEFTLLLAEAGLEDARRRQLRRGRRLPAVAATRTRRSDNGYEVQIDATDAADRTTGAVYGVQVGRHRRPRRRAQPAGGVEHLRAAGRGRAAAGVPQRREDQRLHQHRPGPLAAPATSASRTTAPATTCRSATSGSRSWAAPTRTRRPDRSDRGARRQVRGRRNGGSADGTKIQLWTCTGRRPSSGR